MTSKITLYAEKELIDAVKRYAKSKKISLSKLTSEFFSSLVSKKSFSNKNKRLSDELYGILNDVDEKDYKEYIERKYL
jgi:hypothetical protein